MFPWYCICPNLLWRTDVNDNFFVSATKNLLWSDNQTAKLSSQYSIEYVPLWFFWAEGRSVQRLNVFRLATMEMPHCQTKHQKPCVCVWNTIIMYVWSTGAGLFARKNGLGEKAENTVLLLSYLPCTAKSLYTMSSKTWHHLSKNATTDEILVSYTLLIFLCGNFVRKM